MGLGSDTAGGAESDIGGSESNATDSSDSGDTLGGWEAQVAEGYSPGVGGSTVGTGPGGGMGTANASLQHAEEVLGISVHNHMDMASAAASSGQWGLAVEEVALAGLSSIAGAFGEKLGGAVGSSLGMSLAGPIGAILGGLLGSVLGSKALSSAASSAVFGATIGLTRGTISIDDFGVGEQDLQKVYEVISELSTDELLVMSTQYMEESKQNNFSTLYRRRSNIIGTGLSGLFIE